MQNAPNFDNGFFHKTRKQFGDQNQTPQENLKHIGLLNSGKNDRNTYVLHKLYEAPSSITEKGRYCIMQEYDFKIFEFEKGTQIP